MVWTEMQYCYSDGDVSDSSCLQDDTVLQTFHLLCSMWPDPTVMDVATAVISLNLESIKPGTQYAISLWLFRS